MSTAKQLPYSLWHISESTIKRKEDTITRENGVKVKEPQRKRRGGTVNSRQAQKRTREAASTPEMALEAEPIELVESTGDEIVDLTCESLEPVVVDLTHNDSVVVSVGA
ncbi:hypothetical protein HPG69_016245 [Diceros bicornis minor]|uniref:Ring finger protein 4 n=1 Tax=Diceros bicornis minor TaxID=77932 RepID=A0A7J7ELB7_DICBM|nr:hypothetical protein HPG69_016245 [Diceros bicornis minor]